MNNRGDRRRRIAKACDHCRKGKVRCDGSRPVCGRCQGCGNECHYADIDKPDPRQRRSKVTSRNSLEIPYRQDINPGINAASGFTPNLDTLQTVAQLQPAGVVPDEPNPANSFTESSLVQTLTTDASPCDTIVGGNRDMRYFGPPSGISLVSTATTGRSGQQTPESWSKWRHPLIEPIFARRVMKPLPSWTDAFSLVSEFFTHQHQVFPCFNPPVFMSFLGQQYSSPCNESPTWWVSLNAVLAIAQRRRAEEAQAAEAEDLAWGYASNALAGTWDVLMRGTQLSSVQALLAIAWFVIGTPNPQPSFMLVGYAVRLSLSIGIHIDSQDPSLSPVDSYMRKKVFWIAICLDRELCLRTGRPPCHDLNAVYVDPPLDAHDETEILVTIAGFQVNLFKAQMQLAVIQGSIYQDLHSNKLPTVLSDSISILQERLSTWCAEFAPSLLDNSVQDCEHHGLMRLYFFYYAAVIVVNRAHSLSYWSSPNHSDISTLSPIVRTSIEACIHASRSIIGLTKLIPGRWKSFHWDVIPIPMSAIVLLCINTIRNPVGGIAENDLRSVGDVLHIFKTLDEAYGNTYLTQVRKACQELYRKAQNALRMDYTEFCHRANPDCRAAFGGYQDQTNLSLGAGMSNVFDVDLNTFEQAMPYSVPMLWDLDTSLCASLT